MKRFWSVLLIGSLLLGVGFAQQAQAAVKWIAIYSRTAVTGGAGIAMGTGDVACIKSTGKVYKADADDAALLPAIGLVNSTVLSGGNVSIVNRGILGGLASLTPGQPCFLSATAGAITQTPVAAYPQPIGYAITATTAIIDVKGFSLLGGAASLNSLAVTNNAVVSGRSTLIKNTTITSSLTVNGRTSLVQNVTITSALSVTEDITAGGGRFVTYAFADNNILSNQTATALHVAGSSTVTSIPMPSGGSVVFIGASGNETITSGSFTADVTIAGTVTGLQGIMNVASPNSDTTTQAKDTDTFTAGQLLGVKYTTPGNFAPGNTDDIVVYVTVEY